MHSGAPSNSPKAALLAQQTGKILPQLRSGVQKTGLHSPAVPHLWLRTPHFSLLDRDMRPDS